MFGGLVWGGVWAEISAVIGFVPNMNSIAAVTMSSCRIGCCLIAPRFVKFKRTRRVLRSRYRCIDHFMFGTTLRFYRNLPNRPRVIRAVVQEGTNTVEGDRHFYAGFDPLCGPAAVSRRNRMGKTAIVHKAHALTLSNQGTNRIKSMFIHAKRLDV